MRLRLLALLLCLVPAPASLAEESDARTRALLEQVHTLDGHIEAPVTVMGRPIATVAFDLPAPDGSLTVPVTWTGGVQPVGFADVGPLGAAQTGIFGGNDVKLSIDLTAAPERSLVIGCRVVGSGTPGQPPPVVCGISAPLFGTAEEALGYLRDPDARPAGTVCECDVGGDGIWSLALPVMADDPVRLTAPAGDEVTLDSQSSATTVSMIGGEMRHSERFTLTFEAEPGIRLILIREGRGPLEQSAGGKSATPATLAGRLRAASSAGTLRCEVHEPPFPAEPPTFASADPGTPSWTGEMSCRPQSATGR